jgi:phage nucleotide-binding protein
MKIQKASEISTPRITALIYGTPGMGKTTLLGNLKGSTLIIDVDKGTSVLAGNAHVDVLRLSEDFREIPELMKELKENCPYDNVCLDSLSELERSVLTRLASRNSTGIPSLQDYGKVNNSLLNICRQLRELDANIFFTAWEQYTEVYSPNGEKYSRIEPMVRKTNMENVCGLCDVIGRIYVDKDSEERMLWLDGRPNVIAKDRIHKRRQCNFCDVIPSE